MSESMLVSPSTTAGSHKTRLSSNETGNDSELNDGNEGFTAVFATYTETEPTSSGQLAEENLPGLISQILPQMTNNEGNELPQDEEVTLWQSVLLLQPGEINLSKSAAQQAQGISLLEQTRKPVIDAGMYKLDYFNNPNMQGKENFPGLSSGITAKTISTQLAAAHFLPSSNESALFNVSEQSGPTVQGVNSILSQGLSATGFSGATQAANTQTQMAPLNLGQNAWETNLGSRLQMLIGQNIQTAEIRLDPPELGSLDIKIKVSNDVATVNIASSHAQVRDALETAIPRLREMFSDSGLSLGDVNVRQESFAQQEQTDDMNELMNEVNDTEIVDEIELPGRKIASDSLLDFYA